MAKYYVVIIVSVPEPMPTAGDMVAKHGKSDTKLSQAKKMGD
jgi:hypothetical protein